MSLHILISTSSFGAEEPRPLQRLQECGLTYQLNPYGRKLTVQESIELLRDADGVIAGTEALNQEVLLHTSRLKAISRCGTGIDNVDLETATQMGIRVFNTPDAHVDAVAELTLGGILDALRQISSADRMMRRGEWSKPMGGLLRSKAVGIVGLGRVGKALVKLLHPFDNRILAFDPVRDDVFAQEYGVTYCALEQILRESDLISLHLAYASNLHHLIDRACFELMKPTAILVNCARGGLVDETALFDFLKMNPLAGAYFDTFEQEPYAGSLLQSSNIVLSPHIGSYAREVRVKMEMEAVENLCRFFEEQGRL